MDKFSSISAIKDAIAGEHIIQDITEFIIMLNIEMTLH